MNKKNKELLDKLIEKKLQDALKDGNQNPDALEEAMQAIDRQIELNKIDKDKLVKYLEITAAAVAVPLIEAGLRKSFAKMICTFEKDYTFTTTAGRSLSSLFKFK